MLHKAIELQFFYTGTNGITGTDFLGDETYIPVVHYQSVMLIRTL